MVELRYVATDMLTGQVRCDTLPLRVNSFSRSLSGEGELTADLDLTTAGSAYLSALTPRRTALWVLEDDWPVWSGILWDWTHQSILSNRLPIRASTLESLFQRRKLHTDLTYTASDPYDIFRALLTYTLSKTNGHVANFAVESTLRGTTIARTYRGTDHSVIGELLNNLAGSNDFEWTIDPIIEDGVLKPVVRFGYPHLGRRKNQITTSLAYPGQIVDYGWPVIGSNSVNSMIAVGDTEVDGTQLTSSAASGIYQPDLDGGFPLLEDTVSYAGNGIVNQSTLNAHADVDVAARAGNETVPTVTVIMDGLLIREFALGSYINLSLTSNLHPMADGRPGIQRQARMIGYEVTPGDGGQAQTMKLILGEV